MYGGGGGMQGVIVGRGETMEIELPLMFTLRGGPNIPVQGTTKPAITASICPETFFRKNKLSPAARTEVDAITKTAPSTAQTNKAGPVFMMPSDPAERPATTAIAHRPAHTVPRRARCGHNDSRSVPMRC